MRRFQCIPMMILVVVFYVAGLAAVSFAAEEESVVATVMEDSILETTEGESLEVADTDKGNDLLMNVGKKVKVFGQITEEDGARIIRVASFTVIEE
jgi:hypothetical protein